MDDAEETGRFTEWYEKLFKKQDDPKIGFESAETVLENLRDRYEENEIRCKPIQELVRDNPVGVFVDRKSFAMQKEIAHKETQQQRLQRLFAKYLVDEDAPEKRKGK